MIEIEGNIWNNKSKTTPICVTTNGCIKADGSCVMGRGIAAQAANRYPMLPFELGEAIQLYGNRVLYFEKYDLITFPTKRNWREKSNLDLIKRSAEELIELAETFPNWETVYIPRPGCSNGGRNWETEVKPILLSIFTDKTKIVICESRRYG